MIWKWLHSLKLIERIEKSKELEIKELSSPRNNNRHIMYLIKDQVMGLDTHDLTQWFIKKAWKISLCMIRAFSRWTTTLNALIEDVRKTQYLHRISLSNGRKFKSSSPFLKRLTRWDLLMLVSITTRICPSLRKADRINLSGTWRQSARVQNQFTQMARREFQEFPVLESLLKRLISREHWVLALCA